MHYLDADRAYREKAWRQLHNDSTSYIIEILEATSHLYGHLSPISKIIQIRRKGTWDTAGGARTNLEATFSNGPIHTDVQV